MNSPLETLNEIAQMSRTESKVYAEGYIKSLSEMQAMQDGGLEKIRPLMKYVKSLLEGSFQVGSTYGAGLAFRMMANQVLLEEVTAVNDNGEKDEQ